MDIIDFFSMPENHPLYSEIKRTLIHRGKHPDIGSEFDSRTWAYRRLPDSNFLDALKRDGYGVLIQYEESNFCGYFAYQMRNDDACVFEIAMEDIIQKSKILDLAKKCFDYARQNDIRRIQIGARKEEKTDKLLKILKKREKELGVLILKNNWIRVIPRLITH